MLQGKKRTIYILNPSIEFIPVLMATTTRRRTSATPSLLAPLPA
jgi:hypothetical protein